MQKTFLCISLVLGGVFCLLSPVQAATIIVGNVTTPTTWSAGGSPYVINGNISVSTALTLQPGVVVKLGTASSLFVTTTGSVSASGVTFTSVYDDAHGGAIEPGGSPQSPAVSNGWGALNSSGGLSLQDSQFFYGGRANRGMVEVNSGNATLVNNHFQFANNAFIQSNGTAFVRGNTFEDIEQFGVWQKQGNITFGNNTFTSILGESYLLTKDTFTNEGGNTGERSINLQNMVFSADKILLADSLPYQFNATKINSNVTLTLREGSVVKFWNTANNIINDGTLKVLGTKDKPVVLTSYDDDAAGGDSNKNGTTTVPQAGQWGRIYNNASGRIDLSNTTLRYGGMAGLSETGLIINYGTLTVDKSTLSDSRTKLINTKSGSVTVEKSEFTRAEEAIVSNGQSQVSIHNSDLLATEGYRILNNSSGTAVDASNNYWGNELGPTVNGVATEGPIVSTNVQFDPYFDASTICKVDCFSNVLFLPGIMGSRLYETSSDDEDELWFSSLDDRHERMEMNSNGTSKNDVYTKENLNGITDTAYGKFVRVIFT